MRKIENDLRRRNSAVLWPFSLEEAIPRMPIPRFSAREGRQTSVALRAYYS